MLRATGAWRGRRLLSWPGTGSGPTATKCLIGANLVVFGLAANAPEPKRNAWFDNFRQGPEPTLQDKIRSWLPTTDFWDRHWKASWHAVVSCSRFETLPLSTFMHGDGFHLLFNMFTLFFFGRQLEYTLGVSRYLALYFLSGTVASATQVGYCGRQQAMTQVIGASGGVYSLISFTTLLMPHQIVYLYAVVPCPMWLVMCGIVVADVYLMRPGEAHQGHLAGLGCGMLYYFWLFGRSGLRF
mmetsp:Transcript_13904/g.30692  ORF Transcript_13904/g.30692 Transcript_13904/m.30692 type:complete len:241 (-) Transcript_13904:466-1188(-)